MNGLVWLRSDLRIDDNPALSIADNECEKIVCLYLLSEEEWKTHNNANVKLDFIIQNLSNLSKDLKKLNIPLIVASIKNFDSIPKQIAEFSKSNNISKCYWNNEFGVDEQERDHKVQNMLEIYSSTNSTLLMYASSSSVYGQSKEGSIIKEDKQTDLPVSIYGATKQILETVLDNNFSLNVLSVFDSENWTKP